MMIRSVRIQKTIQICSRIDPFEIEPSSSVQAFWPMSSSLLSSSLSKWPHPLHPYSEKACVCAGVDGWDHRRGVGTGGHYSPNPQRLGSRPSWCATISANDRYTDPCDDVTGINPGDVILEMDGVLTAPEPSAVGVVIDSIQSHPNRPLTLRLQRNDKELTLQATPTQGSKGEGRLGVQLVSKYHLTTRVAQNGLQSLQLATSEFLRLSGEILRGLQQLIFNFSQSAEKVSGPVAIVAMGAEVARLNAPQLYLFAAVVNLNLAVVNTLPLPALDGGYFALLMLEIVRGGKKLPRGVEQSVTASGILFLMAVGCFLVVRDITAL